MPITTLPEPFTEQNEMLNSTLKMVRGRIAGSYEARIRVLYTPRGKDACHEENRQVIRVICA